MTALKVFGDRASRGGRRQSIRPGHTKTVTVSCRRSIGREVPGAGRYHRGRIHAPNFGPRKSPAKKTCFGAGVLPRRRPDQRRNYRRLRTAHRIFLWLRGLRPAQFVQCIRTSTDINKRQFTNAPRSRSNPCDSWVHNSGLIRLDVPFVGQSRSVWTVRRWTSGSFPL